jgi:hypothetical protein
VSQTSDICGSDGMQVLNIDVTLVVLLKRVSCEVGNE